MVVPVTALLLFYFVPLFSPDASIQWDAVDVHYCSQRYLGAEIRAGRLPLWTPYLFSGFPFLADPQVGAFYPLNWPFILAGAGPKLIQAEIALHSLLAMAGALLFFRLHVGEGWAAVFGAIAYPLSGYFAGHASHVGMFQAASLLPWLLFCSERALRGPLLRWIGAAGGTAALIFLTGHLQTALYCCAALAVYVLARTASERRLIFKAPGLLAGVAALAFLISAPMVLPALELTRESIRDAQDYSASVEGVLELRALATLMNPDALGVIGGEYRGPGDRTQFYFYGGILLLPLALLGLVAKRGILIPVTITIVSVWFMLGPEAGLYRMAAIVPYMAKVRAPVHAWFVTGFAVTWLAVKGLGHVIRRLSLPWLGWSVCLFTALDLCLMNSWSNPLTYARRSFDSQYGAGIALFRERIAPAVPEGMRFAAPDGLYSFGPLNSPLEVRLETTYGYNPLQLKRYAEFRRAAEQNPKLLDALSAALWLDPQKGELTERRSALPKAWFPAAVTRMDEEEQRQALGRLDPAREAVLSREVKPARGGRVTGIEAGAREWRIRYYASEGGLMTLSLPWFPGWKAEVGGQRLMLLQTNYALSGLVVPAGEHEVVLQFASQRLGLGLLLTFLGWVLAALLWRWGGAIKTKRFVSKYGQSNPQ
jgi:hypothetical protein